MILTISIACFNQSSITKRCLDALKATSGDLSQVEFILTNNGSSDDTQKVLEGFDAPNKIILNHGKNTGFGEAHNRALELASGQYFLCLNNDIFLKLPGWIRVATAPFEDDNVALVGLSGTPCTLRPDGTGFHSNHIDYIDGGFLLGRTSQLRQLGLFSPAIKMFVCEDSDMGLRYRQAGHKLVHVSIAHRHERHTTFNHTMDRPTREKIVKSNIQVLRTRWGSYLKTKKFHNAILARIPSIGIGDVVCATSVVSAIKRDHPASRLVVETNFPDIFLNNPNVDQVRTNGPDDGFDRVIRLAPDYKKPAPIHTLCADIAATTVDDGRPQLFLSDEERTWAREMLGCLNAFDSIAVLAPVSSRQEWQGRNWNIHEAKRLVPLLHDRGIGVIEVGQGADGCECADLNLANKTSLRQLFAIIEAADLFIGIDSLPLHVAQAFKKPILALFGATKPVSRIVDFCGVSIVRRDDLPCIACYQRIPGGPGINKCYRGDQACMQTITAEMVEEKLFCPNGENHDWNTRYLHGLCLEGLRA